MPYKIWSSAYETVLEGQLDVAMLRTPTALDQNWNTKQDVEAYLGTPWQMVSIQRRRDGWIVNSGIITWPYLNKEALDLSVIIFASCCSDALVAALEYAQPFAYDGNYSSLHTRFDNDRLFRLHVDPAQPRGAACDAVIPFKTRSPLDYLSTKRRIDSLLRDL